MISLPSMRWSCIGSLDIQGYEVIADDFTRDSSVLKFIGPRPASGISRQDIQRRIRCWLVNQHWICCGVLGDTQRQPHTQYYTPIRQLRQTLVTVSEHGDFQVSASFFYVIYIPIPKFLFCINKH